MKKLSLIVCGLLFLSASLYAQDRKRMSMEDRAKMRSERLAEQLSLSDEQKAKVYALNMKDAKENKKMREERRKQVSSMRDNRQEFNKELTDILTPEQQQKWESLKSERREQMKKRFKRKPGMYKKPVQGKEIKTHESEVKG